jgi:hypothetical protein
MTQSAQAGLPDRLTSVRLAGQPDFMTQSVQAGLKVFRLQNASGQGILPGSKKKEAALFRTASFLLFD